MYLGSHTGVRRPRKNEELSVAGGRAGKVKGGQRVKDFARHDKEIPFAWQEMQRCVSRGTLRHAGTYLLQSKESDLPLSEFLGKGL